MRQKSKKQGKSLKKNKTKIKLKKGLTTTIISFFFIIKPCRPSS